MHALMIYTESWGCTIVFVQWCCDKYNGDNPFIQGRINGGGYLLEFNKHVIGHFYAAAKPTLSGVSDQIPCHT